MNFLIMLVGVVCFYTIQSEVATSISTTVQSDTKCPNGEYYFDGCNWCGCKNGFTTCTASACPDITYTTPISTTPAALMTTSETQNEICEAHNGHSLTCTCSNGRYGEMVCRELAKLDKNLPVESLSIILDKNGKCKAEGTYFDGCNYCYCFAGRHKCTKHKCPTVGTPRLIALYVEEGNLVDSKGKCIPYREVFSEGPYYFYMCYCENGEEVCLAGDYFFPSEDIPVAGGPSYTEKCEGDGPYHNECDFCYCNDGYIGYCYITNSECKNGNGGKSTSKGCGKNHH